MGNLYTDPVDTVSYEGVRAFVLDAETTGALTESATLELKGDVSASNVVKAVAGLANADGGLVLVGVSEEAHGEERLMGVTSRQMDGITNSLQSLLEPPVQPEMIAVAIPSSEPQRIIIVIRVYVEDIDRPVVMAGRIYVRGVGATLPARRSQLLGLLQSAVGAGGQESVRPGLPGLNCMTTGLWRNTEAEPAPELEIRVLASMRLVPSAAARATIGTEEKAAVLAALQASMAVPFTTLALGRASGAGKWRFTRTRTDALDAAASLPSSQGETAMDSLPDGVGGRMTLLRSGRFIQAMVGIGVSPWRDGTGTAIREIGGTIVELPDREPLRLSYVDLHSVLWRLRLATTAVLSAVAGADAAQGVQTRTETAVLNRLRDLEAAVDLGPFPVDGKASVLQDYPFPAAYPSERGTDAGAERELARIWLRHLLLDASRREFEADLVRLTHQHLPTSPSHGLHRGPYNEDLDIESGDAAAAASDAYRGHAAICEAPLGLGVTLGEVGDDQSGTSSHAPRSRVGTPPSP